MQLNQKALWKRVEVVEEIGSDWKFHSRQSEATFYDVLNSLPNHILRFVKKNIYVMWKRRMEVALLLEPRKHKRRYVIVLDTKLENDNQKVREAILVLRIAEAYLREHPKMKRTRERLATDWGYDLAVLDKEHIQSFDYRAD